MTKRRILSFAVRNIDRIQSCGIVKVTGYSNLPVMFVSKRRLLDLPGHPSYVTVVIIRRQQIFVVPETVELFLNVLRQQRERYGFLLHEYVVMPDHYHAILTPPKDYRISSTLQHIHGVYAHLYNKRLRRSGKLFQPHFWNHYITDDQNYRDKANSIHMNPVRSGLVENPIDYPWSSAREHLTGKQGYLTLDDWA